MFAQFKNRADAGQKLALALAAYAEKPSTLVLALPRGGVPVGMEIAESLDVPFDLMLVRKIGVPNNAELALGAIAMGEIVLLNEEIIGELKLPMHVVNDLALAERYELDRRNEVYRDGRAPPDVAGKTVILVDDGVATGADIRAAIRAVRHMKAARVVVAVPVAPAEVFELLKAEADEVVCLHVANFFLGVGAFYVEFSQLDDKGVLTILNQSSVRR